MQSLKDFLEESLKKNLAQARRMQPWNIGVEHEFFLMSSDGLPSTIEESQKFLKALSSLPSWRVFEEKNGSITKVSKETPGKGYSQLKYDHEPHLMEISSCFFDSLDQLRLELSLIFENIEIAAESVGVSVSMQDTLEIPSDHQRVTPQNSFYQSLREFRKDVLIYSKKQSNPKLENYASTIAATQIHISGTGFDWFNNPSLVRRLYLYEPFIQGWANLHSHSTKRWKPYAAVYDQFPLVGFPNLETWDIEHWLSALKQTPIFIPEHTGHIHTLSNKTDTKDISQLWYSIRDLQIIRPKIYGSLEFRADPAQKSIDHIMALAALRLGICMYVQNHPKDPEFIQSLDFKGAYKLWWKQALTEKLNPHLAVLELALRELGLQKAASNQFLIRYTERAKEAG
ncbi:MAG: hypothetical protein KA715_03320 [Xanthomonadaceae bacterium]|nr:hypothetical protein [Xanthomonadaceae bacterium]